MAETTQAYVVNLQIYHKRLLRFTIYHSQPYQMVSVSRASSKSKRVEFKSKLPSQDLHIITGHSIEALAS